VIGEASGHAHWPDRNASGAYCVIDLSLRFSEGSSELHIVTNSYVVCFDAAAQPIHSGNNNQHEQSRNQRILNQILTGLIAQQTVQ
jgi:hypothetical protein